MIDLNSKTQALYTHLFFAGFFCIGIAYFFTMFCQGKIRKRVFNGEFMSQFNTEHQDAFNCNAPGGGYPDMGNGYYSEKLSYQDWFTFNNWQRAHMNFLEGFAMFVTLMIIASINAPIMSAIASILYAVGRVLYGLGYMSGGPKGRIFGAILSILALFTACIGAIWSLVAWNKTDTLNPDDTYKIYPISLVKFEKVFFPRV